MKTLKEAIQDYLALRRSLGFKLKKHSRFLEEFAFSRTSGRVADHHPTGIAMGDATTAHPTGGMGRPVERGAWIRAPLECYGPRDVDPAGGLITVSPQTRQTLHLFR